MTSSVAMAYTMYNLCTICVQYSLSLGYISLQLDLLYFIDSYGVLKDTFLASKILQDTFDSPWPWQ